MEAAELVARAWAPGTDFEPPRELNWLYHLGLALICFLWSLSLLVVGLRIWSRWSAKQLGTGKSLGLRSVSLLCNERLLPL